MLSLALAAAAAWGQTSLTPQAGLLLLRNGHVLEGHITRAGDYFIVTLGDSGEIRMRSSEVEAVVASLDEAYEFKARHLPRRGATSHLDLAEWCLRHRLHRHCADQLVAAMQIDPQNPRLLALERRLELATESPHPVVASPPPASSASPGEQIEQAIEDLPPGSVEKFTTVVQPILLNRCAANNCHGPSAPSEFRLLRPPAGQLASRRFTQRNLHATLPYLSRLDPEGSPLLTMPQGRHGTALVAVFDKQSQQQLEELKGWVKLTLSADKLVPPAAVDTAPETPQQTGIGMDGSNESGAEPPGSLPASAISAISKAQPVSSAALRPGQRVMRPAVSSAPGVSAAPPTKERFAPRDRYDPELFNRRFHGK